MTNGQKPLTREERDELIAHAKKQHRIMSVNALRLDATLQQSESRIAALEAEIARLKAVACEWKMFGCEASVVMDADNPGPFICIAPDADYPDRLSLEVNGLDRENAGCLAATLAHWTRTGELPRELGVRMPDVQADASLEPPAAPNAEKE